MKFEEGKTYKVTVNIEGLTFDRYYYISKRSENGYIWIKEHKDLIKDKCRKIHLYKDTEYFNDPYGYGMVFRDHVKEV